MCVVRIWCTCGGGDLSAERSLHMWCASGARLVHVWWWGLKCRKISAHMVCMWCTSGGGDLSAERSVCMWCASNLKFEPYFEVLYPL